MIRWNKILTALKSLKDTLYILIAIVLLSGCSNSAIVKNSSTATADRAQFYIEKAQNSRATQRADWLLLAAESLLAGKRTHKALAVLNQVNRSELTTQSIQLLHLLNAEALIAADHSDRALEQYVQVKEIESLKKYQQVNYHRGYAELLNSVHRNYESALQRIKLSQLLTDLLEVEENRELLWQSLKNVPNLNLYKNSLNKFIVSGWLELASLAKDYADQPEQLLKNLEIWRLTFEDHSANTHLPIDMARAEASKAYQPKIIALLLPESGSLATSAQQIRNGFLTAIYTLPISERPQVLVLDTSGSVNIQELYQQAVDEGANFIIGPLRRQSVEDLSQLEYFPVPVLSINRLADDLFLPSNFYQFGLPVEDEARQVAIRAWQDGLKKALVLIPDNFIGERTSSAFTEQFEQLGGETQQIVHYKDDDDFARSIKQLLGVEKSLERYSNIRQLMVPVLKHEARRRQDAEFLFFKASVDQARRIKPFVDFYYAHDLPLYSTSSIYNGKIDPILDSDLNNILFCDIPWLLSNDNSLKALKAQLTTFLPNSTQTHSARLFALGYDLFTLMPELNTLRNFPKYYKNGLTGQLTVDHLGHVQRKLNWGKFIDGKATLVSELE